MKFRILMLASIILPTKLYLKILFFIKQGKRLNIKNPKSLNEKIQHFKLYGFQDLHTKIADKYLVRDYVRSKIGDQYLIPLIYHTSNPSFINFNDLPGSFVVKSNHASAQVKIVHDIREENIYKLIELCEKWLKEDHYLITKEPQYRNIKRKIIFEELLLDENGTCPNDYKFHCFNGKVEFIQVDLDRFNNHTRNFYDTNWDLLPFSWSPWKNGKEKYPKGKNISKPKNLIEMMTIAEKLSKDFRYVRIDLYNVDGKIYFGEITLHHGSGWERFTPRNYDEIYGRKLNNQNK